jgi:iron(III) transport system substrate-binding protein
MNWRLSKEGQSFQITKLGNITSLKEPPSFPKGWDPKVIKVWVPNFEQFEKLREPWLNDWNKTYGYRQ